MLSLRKFIALSTGNNRAQAAPADSSKYLRPTTLLAIWQYYSRTCNSYACIWEWSPLCCGAGRPSRNVVSATNESSLLGGIPFHCNMRALHQRHELI